MKRSLVASAVLLPLCAVLTCALLFYALFTARTVDAQSPPPVFTDMTAAAGITFQHRFGDFDLSNIVEGTGPGCALFDYDNDGDLDLYFVNGCWIKDVNDNRGRKLRGKLANALYRNDGGTFRDVTAQAGVGDKGFGMGASAADYDNDGDLDLLVLNYGRNAFYRNNGDGTFTDVAESAGLACPSWSLCAPWLDYDGDGDLDVWIANYLEYDAGKFRDFYPAAGYPGPLAYKGQPDRLFRNDGDGTFTDVTKEAGVFFPNGRSMSALAVDFDGDCDPDVLVANDAMPNSFWVNDGKGHFTEEALENGLAFGEGGQGASSMGPVVGDVDRNGLIDVFIPDMGYGCMLFQRAKGLFVDVTAQTNLALLCGQYTGWGGILLDYDNDRWLDVFLATGNAHHLYTEEDVLARYDGKGRFEDVARSSGPYFRTKHVARGAASGDWDNDGDIDIVVMNMNEVPRLLRNDGGNRNHWLKVVPLRADTKMVAIGSEVRVTVGKMVMIQPVTAVNGYLSSQDPRPNFGLGTATRADRVEVRWRDGKVQSLSNVKADQILEIVRDVSK